jgi:hypothetical protein
MDFSGKSHQGGYHPARSSCRLGALTLNSGVDKLLAVVIDAAIGFATWHVSSSWQDS